MHNGKKTKLKYFILPFSPVFIPILNSVTIRAYLNATTVPWLQLSYTTNLWLSNSRAYEQQKLTIYERNRPQQR